MRGFSSLLFEGAVVVTGQFCIFAEKPDIGLGARGLVEHSLGLISLLR
jgi:hypothetical protein